MSRVGTVIDGNYEILAEIGHGGMSTVYLARDRRLSKQWAIKEVKRTANDKNNQVVYQSLLTEANLMKKLDHPRMPRIVNIIEEPDTLFVVMDYIEGRPMDKVLKNNGADKQKDIKAWERQVVQWGIQICEVLEYLHTRTPMIVYRDMKPSNLMLKPDGTINVFDFGIAREYKEGRTGDTTSLGTRGYAAPEQFGEGKQTDARTDIYSLGVTLYEMLTGKDPTEPPYTLYPIRHWNPQLSDGMEWIIQKCTQPDPTARFQSCEELMYYLKNVEGMDRTVIARQKRKLISFLAPAILTVVFLLVGLAGTISYISLVKSAYIEQVQNGNYEQAISINPDRLYVYTEWTNNLYKMDSDKLTADQLGTLQGKLESQLDSLQAKYVSEEDDAGDKDLKEDKETFQQMLYELGIIYWEQAVRLDNDPNNNMDSRPYFKMSRDYLFRLIQMYADDDAKAETLQLDKDLKSDAADGLKEGTDLKPGENRWRKAQICFAIADYIINKENKDIIWTNYRYVFDEIEKLEEDERDEDEVLTIKAYYYHNLYNFLDNLTYKDVQSKENLDQNFLNDMFTRWNAVVEKKVLDGDKGLIEDNRIKQDGVQEALINKLIGKESKNGTI